MKSTARLNLDGILADDYELSFSNSIDYQVEGAKLTKQELDTVWVGLCDALYKQLCFKIADQGSKPQEQPPRIVERYPDHDDGPAF